jgi:hypothetical protein
MSAKELIPEEENVGSRLEPSLSTSRKVIFAEQSQFFRKLNKQDTSIRCAYLFL